MSNEPRAGMDLDPELLAAYIDKRLTPEQRAAVEAQLAADPDSYAVLVETMKAQDVLGLADSSSERPQRRSWWLAGGIAAAAAIAFFVLRTSAPSEDVIIGRIASAAGNERLIAAQLPGFKHAPLHTTVRGSSGPDNLPLLAALEETRQAYERAPSTERRHALGLAVLLAGQFDEAVTLLEQVAAARPNDAAIATELSAAYLERGRTTGSADRARALELARRAALSSDSPAASFNLALALEQSGLLDEAAATWQRVINVERDPAWRQEAEQHLQRLRVK